MTGGTWETEFETRLTAAADATERMLGSLLSLAPLPGETFRPARFLEAMRYACLGGGKRLRPFLLVETARLCGVTGSGMLRAAAAVEMLHCYSLAHDDLPAMDDDDVRRGRPSLHKAFDQATAILAGDSLLTYAFEIMADETTHAEPGVRASLVVGLALASGLGGMAGGQALDLAAEQRPGPLAEEEIMLMQAMKTGALLRFCVDGGALLGGADNQVRAALSRYGDALGAAYQIADDLLDLEGDTKTMGKRGGKDAARNKATLVGALGAKAARARCDEHISAALVALRDAGLEKRGDMLGEAVKFVGSRHF